MKKLNRYYLFFYAAKINLGSRIRKVLYRTKWPYEMEEQRAVSASLLSKNGGACRIQYGTREVGPQTKASERYDLMDRLEGK